MNLAAFHAKFKLWPQFLLPAHGLSRLIGKLSNCEIPAVKNWCIRKFLATYPVNMTEAMQTDAFAFKSFNAFFTRYLKEGARAFPSDKHILASPVDGTLSQFGTLHTGELLQAKGQSYSLHSLLGGDDALVARFKNGHYFTTYLAPYDYHRVHMPIDGVLKQSIYVPGRLFSVKPLVVDNVKSIFTRNERLICYFDTAYGPIAVIFIGAFLVAAIHTVFQGNVTPNLSETKGHWEWNHFIQNGEELGHFELGSTVIVLAANSACKLANLQEGQVVRMGEKIAEF